MGMRVEHLPPTATAEEVHAVLDRDAALIIDDLADVGVRGRRGGAEPSEAVVGPAAARNRCGCHVATPLQVFLEILDLAAPGLLESAAAHERQYLLEFTVPKRGQTGWKQLAYTLDELIPGGEMAPPVTMIESVLEAVYYDYLRSKYTNAESRHDDLEQLMNYSRQFDDVYAFLSQLALLSGVDGGPESQREQESEMVTLSSVHQAKGLEWRAVFVISLCDGLFPNARAVDTEGGLEEERRLFYVALTRARDELYLTHPITRPSGWEGDAMQRRSPFLEEIDADLLEEWHVAPGF